MRSIKVEFIYVQMDLDFKSDYGKLPDKDISEQCPYLKKTCCTFKQITTLSKQFKRGS